MSMFKSRLPDCKAVFVINLLSSYRTTYSQVVDGIRIVEIPALLVEKEDGVYLSREAFERIRKVYEDEQYND